MVKGWKPYSRKNRNADLADTSQAGEKSEASYVEGSSEGNVHHLTLAGTGSGKSSRFMEMRLERFLLQRDQVAAREFEAAKALVAELWDGFEVRTDTPPVPVIERTPALDLLLQDQEFVRLFIQLYDSFIPSPEEMAKASQQQREAWSDLGHTGDDNA